jgi:hypothetical protein
MDVLLQHRGFKKDIDHLKTRVAAGLISPTEAAQQAIATVDLKHG